jgi:ammonia channel protein AmtB
MGKGSMGKIGKNLDQGEINHEAISSVYIGVVLIWIGIMGFNDGNGTKVRIFPPEMCTYIMGQHIKENIDGIWKYPRALKF